MARTDRRAIARKVAASPVVKRSSPLVIAELEREIFGPPAPALVPYEPVLSRMLSPGTEHATESHVYRFPNGYGASVIRGHGTYGWKQGLYELAVIRFSGPGPEDWDIVKTRLTQGDTVAGWLTVLDLASLLKRISKLTGNYRPAGATS